MDYQDALAVLGVGSAHPGGYSATLELVRSLPIPKGSRILEVGCGTGRTACLLAKQKRAIVTAVDIREKMIEKAKIRARKENVSINFQVADAEKLHFADGMFDIVFVESVTVFTRIAKSFSEYCRVTKPGGLLYDREMCRVKPLSRQLQREIARVYGAKEVPSFDEWIHYTKLAGYRQAGLLDPSLIPLDAGIEEMGMVDLHQEVSPEAFGSEVQGIVADNMIFMKKYYNFLGYSVVSAVK